MSKYNTHFGENSQIINYLFQAKILIYVSTCKSCLYGRYYRIPGKFCCAKNKCEIKVLNNWEIDAGCNKHYIYMWNGGRTRVTCSYIINLELLYSIGITI